ncbi:MAG: hypothetical protein RL141_957 [Candidatus Parcubacteria bacterium]|jgi:hypothetical protein
MRSRLCVFLLGALLVPGAAFAMTSTNYGILWDSVNTGGEDSSSSTNFRLRDTVGEQATGFSQSQTYQVSAGYRVGDEQDPSLSLTIGTQENNTRAAWTAFSNVGNTVTVTATSSFTIGNYIGVIENIGASQLIAVGKITAISGADITVDDWEGEPASLSASPAGGNDHAYRLNGANAALGTQSFGQVATSLTVTDIVSNVLTGYSVTVQASSTLQNDQGLAIADVSDGGVTAGSEEYGREVVGTTAQGAGSDLAFTTSTQTTIQTSDIVGDHDRIGLIYKLSITAGTPAGNYRQNVLYRLTPNF